MMNVLHISLLILYKGSRLHRPFNNLTNYLVFVPFLLFSCKDQDLFTQLSPEETGIEFANRIAENDTMNILSFEYIYNGGGVALGDFNNDNLTDIYFTGNTTSNKLYLNKGDFKFEDVTPTAGVSGQGKWSSGVALVDINNDNKLDIYVCATARKSGYKRANMLYVNQGNDKNNVPKFKEMAAEYGIADTTHTTNAAFFDYDNDGDLDLYLVVNEMDDTRFPNQYHEKIKDGSSKRTDKLYRNDTPLNPPLLRREGEGRRTFTDVSKEAGIQIEGYGLGVNICDINRDGWKDIYVTNDYLTNDLFYINNRGKFTDQADQFFKHTSHSAMGNDVADINNDGLADIIALDMMPASNYRKKMMVPANSYVTYQNNDRYGYLYQYARNTLQLNRGMTPLTKQPIFSEVGLLADVAETDWSWTPMVTDFDNDGLRDIIVTNGFPRDITDQDFVAYRMEVGHLMTKQQLTDYIPSVKINNFAFKNKGNLAFEDVTEKWGIRQPSFSNGAAYADLDNDGDLDYVVNNINDSASVYRNNLRQQKPEESNYLRIKFKGNNQNVMGFGAIVETNQGDFYEHTPYRGYLSSVEPIAHFGLGTKQQIETLKVTWQTGKVQILKNVKANQVITLDEKNATYPSENSLQNLQSPIFSDITELLNIPYKHQETDFIDFNLQKLLPHKLSQYGPSLAVGDVNGDRLEDVFIGGSSKHKGKFLMQNKLGHFELKDLLPGRDSIDKESEDMGSLLFDADLDGDLDLYVVSGSYEFSPDSPALQDRFYVNDGKGHFVWQEDALPKFLKSGSCIKAVDYDHDGDLDLFVGGRVEPHSYPKPVSSYILRNDSRRQVAGNKQLANNQRPIFTDITSQIAPELKNIGLVCDALWTDYDNDGWQDLMLAGEWMPITLLKNSTGKIFSKISPSGGLGGATGWWNSLAAGDFDNDGDIDYVAGNLGTNSLHRASETQPVHIYAKDFNKDGFFDAIPTVYYRDAENVYREFPYNSRDDLAKQFIQTRQRFQNYAKFSAATINEILKPEEIKDALILEANYLKSSYIENKGNGVFEIRALPIEAQIAPVFGIIVQDFDQDGNLDVLLTGNDYSTEVSVGRYDASMGLVLKGNGKGNFKSLSPQQSGYCVNGDSKSVVSLIDAKGQLLTITAQNRDKLRIFEYLKPIQTRPVQANDAVALLTLKNGKIRRQELSYGNSYLSQTSRALIISSNIQKIEIIGFQGKKRIVP